MGQNMISIGFGGDGTTRTATFSRRHAHITRDRKEETMAPRLDFVDYGVLCAELSRLAQENERLQAEVTRLRGSSPTSGTPPSMAGRGYHEEDAPGYDEAS